MVGAVVVRLTPSESTAALELSNSSMSNDSSADEYKVMVAATVTILSGIIQVSTFSCDLPSPFCLPCLVHIFPFFLLPATPPLFPLDCIPLSRNKKGPSPQPEAEEKIHLAKMSECGSREKERWEQGGTSGEERNA